MQGRKFVKDLWYNFELWGSGDEIQGVQDEKGLFQSYAMAKIFWLQQFRMHFYITFERTFVFLRNFFKCEKISETLSNRRESQGGPLQSVKIDVNIFEFLIVHVECTLKSLKKITFILMQHQRLGHNKSTKQTTCKGFQWSISWAYYDQAVGATSK